MERFFGLAQHGSTVGREALAMPLTFSIATGIGLGIITYAAVKLLSGRLAEAGPAIPILALAFILKFAFL